MDSICISVLKLVAINGDCTTLARVVGWYRVRMWEAYLFLPLCLREESNGWGEELAEASCFKLGKEVTSGWTKLSELNSSNAPARSWGGSNGGSLGTSSLA